MPQPSNSRSSHNRWRLGRLSLGANSFLGRHLWAWPLLAALVLAGVGTLAGRCIRDAIADIVTGHITGIRDAEVTALQQWLRNQEAIAETAAADNDVVQLASALFKLGELDAATPDELKKSPHLQALRQQLQPLLKAHQLADFLVISSGLRVIGSNLDQPVGIKVEGVSAEYFRKALAGHSHVSMPYPAMMPLPDEHGVERANLPTMFSAAPIKVGDEVIAVLGLRIRPEFEFTKILRLAKYGQTGETYAINRNGLFLSCSRFDDELKQYGLLPDQPQAGSILTLEARDPGANLKAGERRKARRSDQPLTHAAAAVIRGEDGVQVKAYPDYRGVPTVGAWAWVPKYDFGIICEVEEAEAYCPLTILGYAYFGLLGLLALAALVIFLFMLKNARQQRKLREAVLANKQLGQYTLEDKIGAGGMGTVYRARHALLRRPTAVKLLQPDMVSEAAIARFEREVQLTSQLNHPNTIQVFDFGRTPEGVFYYAMEYLDGMTLEELGEKFGAQPDGRVIDILIQICGSLAEAHAAGMIHRDIKPANIILGHRGGVPDLVKVLDFGLAKLADGMDSAKITNPGMVVGTPLYLAPEAIANRKTIDARVDLYAVGAVGYFLMTGQPPFTGESMAEIMQKHFNATPELPSECRGYPANTHLEALILRCLEKQPDNRPASAHEVLLTLETMDKSGWGRAKAEAWWREHRPEAATTKPAETSPVVGVTAAFVRVGAS